VSIHYTTDGSSPISSNAAVYDGAIRVPANCRKICAVAQAPAYSLTSQSVVLDVPKRGDTNPIIDATRPARWQKVSKLDDTGAVWNLISQLEQNPGVVAYDVHLSAQSRDGEQIVDYTGSLADGYGGAELQAVAVKLQDIVQDSTLRMEIHELGFPTGQALIDWLNVVQQPFDLSHVSQN
jgi:Fn3 associated